MFRSAFITNNNISITGPPRSRPILGHGEEGSIQTEKFSKITVNLNSEYNVTDYLKFGFQVNGAKSKTPDAKGVGSIVRAAPIAPVFYDYTDPATGKTERLLHTMPDFQRAQLWNPLVETFIRGNHNLGVNHRVGNIYGEVKFRALHLQDNVVARFRNQRSTGFAGCRLLQSRYSARKRPGPAIRICS